MAEKKKEIIPEWKLASTVPPKTDASSVFTNAVLWTFYKHIKIILARRAREERLYNNIRIACIDWKPNEQFSATKIKWEDKANETYKAG